MEPFAIHIESRGRGLLMAEQRMERAIANHPNAVARAIALFSLSGIVTGVIAQGFIADRLIIPGDPAATATNILVNRGLYEFAFTIFMVEMACQIAMAVLWYRMLRPVNKSAATVAVAWNLTGSVLKLGGRVLFLAPLLL